MTRTLLALALVSLALLQPAVNAEVIIKKDARRTILLKHTDGAQHNLCVGELEEKMQAYAAKNFRSADLFLNKYDGNADGIAQDAEILQGMVDAGVSKDCQHAEYIELHDDQVRAEL